MKDEPVLTVLVAEEDPRYRRLLAVTLRQKQYHVIEAVSGRDLLDRLFNRESDLVVLDLGLPDMDGLNVCTRIRQFTNVPIMILTAGDSESRLIESLDAGADDYMTKPFSPEELAARARALIRRSYAMYDLESDLVCGDVHLMTHRRVLVVRDESFRLTPTEWRLMREFILHCGEVLTHEYLLQKVWGLQHVEEHEYLRVYIRNLRRYIEKDPHHPCRLMSYVGVGYALHPDDTVLS